jgi:hypothetical protein
MLDVDLRLNAQNARNISIAYSLNILFCLGVRTDKNPSVSDLIKGKPSNKIGIRFLDMSVDQKDKVRVSPLEFFLISWYFTVALVHGVFRRVDDLEITRWLTFPDDDVIEFIKDRILVGKPLRH